MDLLEFKDALSLLEYFILIETSKVNYKVSSVAPSTFKEMVEVRQRLGYFIILKDTSNGSIYSAPEINEAFRALHDKMHYETGLKFTYKDEKRLSEITALKVFKWLRSGGIDKNRAYNAFKIVREEIKGQIEHYERFGRFVDNQENYIKERLGIAA